MKVKYLAEKLCFLRLPLATVREPLAFSYYLEHVLMITLFAINGKEESTADLRACYKNNVLFLILAAMTSVKKKVQLDCHIRHYGIMDLLTREFIQMGM